MYDPRRQYMDFLKTLEENALLLVSQDMKEPILHYIHEEHLLVNIKFISFQELKKGLLFDYTNETIYEVMKYYHASYGVAKNWIENLYYIEDKVYDNEKLSFLKEIKNYLQEKELLKKDLLFPSFLKSRSKLYLYGFHSFDPFQKYLLSLAHSLVTVEPLEMKSFSHEHDVHLFSTLEKEVVYVADKIATLLIEGIPLNKIYLVQYPEEYTFTIHRIFKAYGIPFSGNHHPTLYHTAIGTYFLNHLEENMDSLLYKIKKHFKISENPYNEKVYNILVNLVNTYYWCDSFLEVREMLEQEMRQKKLNISHSIHELKKTSFLNHVFSSDEYIFLLGFNLDEVPKMKRDEDYLSDDEKTNIMETSVAYNKRVKESWISALKNTANVTITLKEKSSFSSYFPSLLIEQDFLHLKKLPFEMASHSHKINREWYAKRLDRFLKFNEYSHELEMSNQLYKIPYRTYQNKFTGIDENRIQTFLNGQIAFSYTNISTYYECPFKFYLKYVLRIDSFEQTIYTFIGTLFHHCLERCLDSHLSVDEVYDAYVKEQMTGKQETYEEQFFLAFLKKEIKFIIESIRLQYTHSSHTESWHEKEITIPMKRKIETTLKGYVDNVLVLNNKVLIIDYKTGHIEMDPALFPFGIGIQLPIYLYLLTCIDKNTEVVGMYLQHILDLNEEYQPKKDLLEEKRKKLRLDGITFANMEDIKLFDETYEASEVIKSLGVTKKGEFKKSKKVIALSERETLSEMMENLIIQCIDRVSSGEFSIAPIKIEKKADGCAYCKFKDICYVREKDFHREELVEDRKEGDDFE